MRLLKQNPISLKRPQDFERMKKAGKCVTSTHQEIANSARPGVSLRELDAIAARVIQSQGCQPSFLNYAIPSAPIPYPGTICASPNDVIVHGIPSDYRLEEGDILSVDVGAIFDRFHGDAAFTMAIGEILPEVERLLNLTHHALWEGIGQVFPGSRVGDIGAAVASVGESAGYGIVREYTGHGIGLSMHEPPNIPNYGEPGTGPKLKVGMAIAIEPMFNLGSEETFTEEDGWTVRTADGSLSAHFEHTVALTPDGVVVTTYGSPADTPENLDKIYI